MDNSDQSQPDSAPSLGDSQKASVDLTIPEGDMTKLDDFLVETFLHDFGPDKHAPGRSKAEAQRRPRDRRSPQHEFKVSISKAKILVLPILR